MTNSNLPPEFTVKISGAPYVLVETEEDVVGEIAAVDHETVTVVYRPRVESEVPETR